MPLGSLIAVIREAASYSKRGLPGAVDLLAPLDQSAQSALTNA
jgi:hypothetical protein